MYASKIIFIAEMLKEKNFSVSLRLCGETLYGLS